MLYGYMDKNKYINIKPNISDLLSENVVVSIKVSDELL